LLLLLYIIYLYLSNLLCHTNKQTNKQIKIRETNHHIVTTTTKIKISIFMSGIFITKSEINRKFKTNKILSLTCFFFHLIFDIFFIFISFIVLFDFKIHFSFYFKNDLNSIHFIVVVFFLLFLIFISINFILLVLHISIIKLIILCIYIYYLLYVILRNRNLEI
jgi:hypothetical protein